MTDDRPPAAPPRPEVDVARLRVEPAGIQSQVDHFCPLCGCTKSGWASDPNPGCEWCEDVYCACHDEDLP